ncbi:unnamed protein product [Mycena citricolor]|uniref:Uncharacterized protein n=1 Tax=Mycena citricolor TaxID=2018698 RepID=A0AAD2HEL1_9AGAR|nr:unnamed protein product [Mycena citricolor]
MDPPLSPMVRRPSLRGRSPAVPMGPRSRNVSSRNSILPAETIRSPTPGQSMAYPSGPLPQYTERPTTPYSTLSGSSDAKSSPRTYASEPPPSISEAPEPLPATTPTPTPAPTPTPLPADSPAPTVVSAPKMVPLAPPVQISFESVPVKWKGLPLEAALWTFDSRELQDIVSRAIRGSSRESFIRVLSVENLDRVLPSELERLTASKSTLQAKYRFNMQRRTMLLQALHSASGCQNQDSDAELMAKLTSQLSEVTSECDQLLEQLLQIADQMGQITSLQDVHWASALAIALRKLNASYGRRTSDLLNARAKIATLEAELNDAWGQAETLAKELDEFEAAGSDDEGEAVIEVAEVISLNHRKSASASSSVRLLGQKEMLSLDIVSRMASDAATPASPMSPVSPTMFITSPIERIEQTTAWTETDDCSPAQSAQDMLPTPSASELEDLLDLAAKEAEMPESPVSPVDTPVTPFMGIPMPQSDAVSVRSGKSSRTHRSQRGNETSRVDSVSAARRRSVRTSMGSLRLPKSSKGPEPPVPLLPSLSASSSSSVGPDHRSVVESFLDFGPASDSEADDSKAAGSQKKKRTSIEDLSVVTDTPPLRLVPVQQTRDDIQIMPRRSAVETELVTPRRSQFSLDHQHPFAIEAPSNPSIPSIWLLQDTPKTPAERVDQLMMRERGHVKMGSLQRLKTLTKRYSLPFPAPTLSRSMRSKNAT